MKPFGEKKRIRLSPLKGFIYLIKKRLKQGFLFRKHNFLCKIIEIFCGILNIMSYLDTGMYDIAAIR